jgi:hypothetical protein
MSYKGESITGEKRRRAYRVEALNPVQGEKVIVFHEEDYTALSTGQAINQPQGAIRAALVDPNKVFQVVHPADDKPIEGQFATHGQVYALLHSLYLSLAHERDEAESEAGEHANIEG